MRKISQKGTEVKNLIVGPLLTNCYLLISKKEAAVIDPGGGLKKILEEIEKSKAKLKYIILTHSHWDHTLAALKLKEKTGAKILIHKDEKDFIKFKIDKFLEEGEEIKIGDNSLKVIHTPGHSKGSICLVGENFTLHHQQVSDMNGIKISTMRWVSSIGGAGFIFTGDTLFEDSHGRTDLVGGSQKDMENSLEKLEKILNPGMKGARRRREGGGWVVVYPGHGEIFAKL